MTTEVGIKELRDGLSRYIDEVPETGRQVIVTDRGRPVVKLVPLGPWDERYARMVASGAITPASKPPQRVIPRPTIKSTPGPTTAEVVVQMHDPASE